MRMFSLIPAARYCGITPQELIQQVKRGHLAPPNGEHRWSEEELEDWCIDNLRLPAPQIAAGDDAAISFMEARTVCGLTHAQIRNQIASGKFPPRTRGSSFRLADVERYLMGERTF